MFFYLFERRLSAILKIFHSLYRLTQMFSIWHQVVLIHRFEHILYVVASFGLVVMDILLEELFLDGLSPCYLGHEIVYQVNAFVLFVLF